MDLLCCLTMQIQSSLYGKKVHDVKWTVLCYGDSGDS